MRKLVKLNHGNFIINNSNTRNIKMITRLYFALYNQKEVDFLKIKSKIKTKFIKANLM